MNISLASPGITAAKPLSVLIVEDSQHDTELLVFELRRGGYEPAFRRVDSAPAMSSALKWQKWDLVVADFSMPHFNALAALELLRDKGGDQPFIIVSGTIGEELAVEAMKNGAQDYILKGNLKRLVPVVERELREAFVRRERKRTEVELFRSQGQCRVAQEIQLRLFPKDFPHFGPVDIAGASYPGEATGGDYFDYLPIAGEALELVVADVRGHGIGSALLAERRAYLRTLALETQDLGQILTRANQMLARDLDAERYVTMLLARLETSPPTLVYASAGHPAGFVLDGSGKTKVVLNYTGVPLGIPPREPYVSAPALPLSPGDIVLLLTGGIEEAVSFDESPFGRDRILEVVRGHAQRSAAEILRALIGAVKDFSSGSPQVDDLTAVVAKVAA